MEGFVVLDMDECVEINAGIGPASVVAGAMAGAIIGTFATFVPAVVAKDPSIVGHGALLGAAIGAFIGAESPLP